MELRICCDASVKLDKMTNVMNVDCSVGDYQVDGDTLNGNIIISGDYIKDVIEETFDFSETVPFTLVFKDKNYLVESISVQDFTCQEIINQGIECNFNIFVEYTPKEVVEEVPIKEIPNEAVPVVDEVEIDDELPVGDDEIKKGINQKYDDLLNEILESRADENFLEKSKVAVLRNDDDTEDCRGILNNIKETYTNYRVYYTNKESDIEKICKAENLSVDKVYKDNKSFDFINKKRIIIK